MQKNTWPLCRLLFFITEQIVILPAASASLSSRKKRDILELIKLGLRCSLCKDFKNWLEVVFWKEVTHGN